MILLIDYTVFRHSDEQADAAWLQGDPPRGRVPQAAQGQHGGRVPLRQANQGELGIQTQLYIRLHKNKPLTVKNVRK